MLDWDNWSERETEEKKSDVNHLDGSIAQRNRLTKRWDSEENKKKSFRFWNGSAIFIDNRSEKTIGSWLPTESGQLRYVVVVEISLFFYSRCTWN